MKISKETKSLRNRRLKRRNTLIKRAHDFYMDFGFKVYLMLEGGQKRYIYTSNGVEEVFWPPDLANLVRRFFP